MAKKTFKIRGNMAQALNDTVTSAINNAGELNIEAIPLRMLELDPENPRDLLIDFEDIYSGIKGTPQERKRKSSEKDKLQSIAKSIKEQGVLNPVVVYKHGGLYRLIAGERRTLASILAEKTDIPARILGEKPGALKLSLLQWIENIEREDLSLWERLKNIEKITGAYSSEKGIIINKITASSLAELLGCSIQQASNYKAILMCSESLRECIKLGEISNIEKAAIIAKSHEDRRPQLIQACIDGSTLAEMKKIANGFAGLTIDKSTPSINKVNFGSTKNIAAAKAVLSCVFRDSELAIYTKDIDVSWDDNKSISLAFRKLLKSLESV